MAPISFRVFYEPFGYVSSAVTRADVIDFSERVGSEIFESMNLGLPNQIAGANRRPPWASATAFGSRSSTWLAHVGLQAAVAQRSAGCNCGVCMTL